MQPVEPEPSRWQVEPAPDDYEHELWVVGADLEPGTILAGYRLGLFPMPVRLNDRSESPIGWWSPALRGVLPLDRRPPRTVRRVAGRYEIRIDSAFTDVIHGCADPVRPHGWIDERMIEAYVRLFDLGWVHSVECWDHDGLAGGLYGVSIGALFSAESMFQRRPDAAKCALDALVKHLRATSDAERRLLDVQWCTPHLALLGAVELPRSAYHVRLGEALRSPATTWP